MHARAAAVFVELAVKYKCSIRVRKGEVDANGKSIMGVLQLGAVQGEVIEIIADGEDSQEAINALAKLIEERFSEEE
jgi:phosphocarrier protein